MKKREEEEEEEQEEEEGEQEEEEEEEEEQEEEGGLCWKCCPTAPSSCKSTHLSSSNSQSDISTN